MIKIHEGILRPQALAQLFTGHYFARALQQRHQYLKRLQLQLEARSAAAQLRRLQVGFELIEFVFQYRFHAEVAF